MIELTQWIAGKSWADRPWLVLGKGPTFAQHSRFDLSPYGLIGLNHVVRERKLDIAHIIDIDVVQDCADVLSANCDYLLMPRYPHISCKPTVVTLDYFAEHLPVLRELDRQGRLVWYNLGSSPPVGDSPVVTVKYFSAEAAVTLLGLMGVKQVRSLGVDGGRSYSQTFNDLKGRTLLANGHGSFDGQFEAIEAIVQRYGMDYAPLAEVMRVFVGVDDSQMVACRVLEHSIAKYASGPVEVVPMLNMPVPMPRDPANAPRTGFSFNRFLIPQLAGYRGRALYLDADMQVFADLAELWRIPFGSRKVLCTVQNETPQGWHDGKAGFTPGRQMSVMLLDCSRLRWDVKEVIRGLDDKMYTYKQLMTELAVVAPDEIGDDIPPQWNSLETLRPGETKLLHYTIVPTQPWKNDDNPLEAVWREAYREAVRAGVVPPGLVRQSIQKGYVKASLEADLGLAAEVESSVSPAETESLAVLRNRLLALEGKLESVESSASYRLGRALTYPLRFVADRLRPTP